MDPASWQDELIRRGRITRCVTLTSICSRSFPGRFIREPAPYEAIEFVELTPDRCLGTGVLAIGGAKSFDATEADGSSERRRLPKPLSSLNSPPDRCLGTGGPCHRGRKVIRRDGGGWPSPRSYLPKVIEGLAALHRNGLRYPVHPYGIQSDAGARPRGQLRRQDLIEAGQFRDFSEERAEVRPPCGCHIAWPIPRPLGLALSLC